MVLVLFPDLFRGLSMKGITHTQQQQLKQEMFFVLMLFKVIFYRYLMEDLLGFSFI